MIQIIKLLILYYLNIKPTHGYEIQKFIQLNHMHEWNNIQSGSIYYAMGKLEKEGLIELMEKVGDKEKSRKIYAITQKGKDTLKEMAREELQNPIGNISSDKYLVYPIIGVLNKPDLLEEINSHIKELEKKKESINAWFIKKLSTATEIEKVTFELMLSNITNQIKWHEVLAQNIDNTIEVVQRITKLIKTVDFSLENVIGYNTLEELEK